MPSTFTQLLVHFVFATKHRAATINSELQDELYRYIGGVLQKEDARLLAIGGMPDHVHVLIGLRPTHSLPGIVKSMKGASSRWLNASGRLSNVFAWQEGYGAFTVSPSQLERVRRYILHQPEHHRVRSFGAEWDDLVRHHRLADLRDPWPASVSGPSDRTRQT